MSAVVSRVADSVCGIAEKAIIFELTEWAEAWATAHGLDQETAFAVRLCVEEAVTNIVFYAYDDDHAPGDVSVTAARTSEGVMVTITDQGRPFDVATADDPGREGDIMSATIGGRGIRLMRSFSNRLAYQRLGQSNRLTLTFFTDEPAPDR